MDVSKFHCTPSWDMHLNINRHECTQLYYAEWNENNKFRENFRKSKNGTSDHMQVPPHLSCTVIENFEDSAYVP